MKNLNDWLAILPEGIVVVAIVLMLLLDLFLPKKVDRKVIGYLGIAGLLLAIVATLSQLQDPLVALLHNTIYIDGVARAFKLILLLGGLLTLLLALGYQAKDALQTYRSEFYYVFLIAVLGAMVLASSYDLITIFIGLELLSLSSLILIGIRKFNIKANEAALKYIVNGGIAAAITLFGLSYLYGITGSTNIAVITERLTDTSAEGFQFIAIISMLLILVGVSFKIAAVPFQMWAPDVYQASYTPVTAFLSVVSKAAGFILLIRVFYSVFADIFVISQTIIAVLASVTLLVGSLLALRQVNLKRMMAYSGIAHSGYLLLAFAAPSGDYSFKVFWFYLISYLLTSVGFFAIIQLIENEADDTEYHDFAGLYQRSPFVAISATIYLLSLAGIPGTAGFIAKLNIFMLLLGNEHELVVFALILLLGTVISYVYYFRIIVQIFFRRPRGEEILPEKSRVVWFVLGICAVAVLVLGVLPNLGLELFQHIIEVTR